MAVGNFHGKRASLFGFLLLFMLIGGCRASAPEDELAGRVTFWHSWPPEEAPVLQEALARFQEIHPDVRITAIAVPEDSILDAYRNAANDGLGPSLMLGSDSWIGELAESGMIRAIVPNEVDTAIFTPRNITLTGYEGQLYGVPLSLAPRALYYNKRLVSRPPATLDALLEEAAAGRPVAFVPRFDEAYWGIQAFGEGLFDAQQRFTLAESGFEEWLEWLNDAQGAPGVILSVDDDSLFDLFAGGQVAYYVAGPEKLTQLAAVSAGEGGEEPLDFGVTSLPTGPHGPGGPLLPAETILFYSYATEEQARVANALAAFLVNQQQSIQFMRELERVPANPAVRVDPRIYPVVSGFSSQARDAVVIPNEIASEPLTAAGNRAYVSVLSGVSTPAEAVCRFGLEVAEIQGYSASDMSLPDGCELPVE